uniref:Uncharacterized protein n=1 Tax=Leersia perrieri TaxID=77586 RepID=A0A0D9WVE5_9ORYZ
MAAAAAAIRLRRGAVVSGPAPPPPRVNLHAISSPPQAAAAAAASNCSPFVSHARLPPPLLQVPPLLRHYSSKGSDAFAELAAARRNGTSPDPADVRTYVSTLTATVAALNVQEMRRVNLQCNNAPYTETGSKSLLHKMKNLSDSRKSLVDMLQKTEVRLELSVKILRDCMKASSMIVKVTKDHQKLFAALRKELEDGEKTAADFEKVIAMLDKEDEDLEKAMTSMLSLWELTYEWHIMLVPELVGCIEAIRRHLELRESVDAHLKHIAEALKKGAKGCVAIGLGAWLLLMLTTH